LPGACHSPAGRHAESKSLSDMPISEITDYNIRNAHPRDCRIDFEPEAHEYRVTCHDGSVIVCDSVTTVIGDLFEKFDADYWAARKATPDCPAEELKRRWAAKGEEARHLGTQLHDRIERHYLGQEPSPEALADKAFRFFLDFDRIYSLKPYRSEWRIFSEKYRIAGTLDFLACADGGFVIYDWKRSSKIVDRNGALSLNSYGKHAAWPVETVPDTVYYHYALQVSLYRYILETEYGIEPREAFLGTFHPDYDRFHVVAMPYLRNEVAAILNSRL
ncbi:MAG: PD-(D/E)XK nuclease family protein, partial [Muribaculaceae bacterium]|nr:PD-(D/E)XK nuclease family protein [Muribaculaceae bacterium]